MIDADSRWCDQCGAMMYLCPDHMVFGKGAGKRCGLCGKPLVAGDSIDRQQPVQPGGYGTMVPPALPAELHCAAMNITIPLMEGGMIGRTQGNYTGVLGQCIYISGTHAMLGRDASGWTITDLKSRNGTKVNGVPCTPHQAVRIKAGDVVRIANFYDFTVR